MTTISTFFGEREVSSRSLRFLMSLHARIRNSPPMVCRHAATACVLRAGRLREDPVEVRLVRLRLDRTRYERPGDWHHVLPEVFVAREKRWWIVDSQRDRFGVYVPFALPYRAKGRDAPLRSPGTYTRANRDRFFEAVLGAPDDRKWNSYLEDFFENLYPDPGAR